MTRPVVAPRRAIAAFSAGRFDRSVASLERSVRRIRSTPRGRGPLRRRVALIAGTEASRRTQDEMGQVLGAPGWAYAHVRGRGDGECWATWDTDVLELTRKPYARQITDQTWTWSPAFAGGADAAYVHALVVPLRVVGRPNRRAVTLIVVHMPLDNTSQRAATWVDCARGLRQLVAELRADDPHAQVLIEADWNKNHRQRNERQMVERYVAEPLGLVQAWDGSAPARGGTHGARALIDGAVASRGLLGATTPWCWLLPDDASSDHRPLGHALRWPLLPARARNQIRSTTKEKHR